MNRRGGQDQINDALNRWQTAGLISEQTAETLRTFESQRPADHAPPGATARVTDAAAVIGAALIIAAAMVLAFAQFNDDFPARIAVLSIAGAAALGLSFPAARLRFGAAADILAGGSVLLWTVCLVAALDEIAAPGDAELGWLLICAVTVLLAAAIWRWTHSRSAGALGVLAWIALPAALAISTAGDAEEFAGPFPDSVSAARAWGALILACLATALLAVATHRAAHRNRIDRWTASGAVLLASTALAVGIVMLAVAADERSIYAATPVGAAALTGVALWRRDWLWLPAALVLFVSAGGFALGELYSPDGRALGTAVLALSLFPFAPLARRLPSHWTVHAWEAVVWLISLWLAGTFAFESGGWPAAGGVWSTIMILLAASRRRWLALAIGVVGLYITFLAVVIEQFNAGVGAGVGTLIFGLLVLSAALFWRRRRFDTDQPRS